MKKQKFKRLKCRGIIQQQKVPYCVNDNLNDIFIYKIFHVVMSKDFFIINPVLFIQLQRLRVSLVYQSTLTSLTLLKLHNTGSSLA